MKKKTNYLLQRDSTLKFILSEEEKFILPTKIYGNLTEKVDRVCKTFKERPSNLGVLLSGIKGNSKTTLAKMICIKSGLPVVLITEPFVGADFKAYLSSIKEEVIVFVDEFEKVYNTAELQQEFLTILEGVFQSKKMFIFTTNSEKINEFLKNRPGRIFYHFKHDNLEQTTTDEIIATELKNKDHEVSLRAVLQILGNISIDVLLNLIDEVNRFDRDAREMVKGLNIEVEQVHFNVHLYKDGFLFMTKCDFNPLTQNEFYLSYKDDKGHYGSHYGEFRDYTMYPKGGSFVFENPKVKMVFTPYKPQKFEL